MENLTDESIKDIIECSKCGSEMSVVSRSEIDNKKEVDDMSINLKCPDCGEEKILKIS